MMQSNFRLCNLPSKGRLESSNNQNLDDSRASQHLRQRNFLSDSELERANAYKRLISAQTETQKRREKDGMMEEELQRSTKLIPENERRYLTEYVKKDLDLFYVNKIVGEMLKSVRRYEGREAILEDYGKLVAFVVKKLENDKFLKGMDEKKKHIVVREINRIFSEKFDNVKEYKENI